MLLEFESPDLLDEMEMRGLVRSNPNTRDYLPTAGTFALLSEEDDLYQRAFTAFAKTVPILWSLYRRDAGEKQYQADQLLESAAEFGTDGLTQQVVDLGLYLCEQFGVFSTWLHNPEKTRIESFRLAESVIRMRDPMPWWAERVRRAREQMGVAHLAAESAFSSLIEEISPGQSANDFWSHLNPFVAAEAMPRFYAGHFADAVEASLKVVCREVRNKTGLKDDGTSLMNKAFSTKKPHLVFDDPLPETQAALQQGYLLLFSGTMMAVRNPKAHGLVQIDARRCMHFLFLASLLADKIAEARLEPPGDQCAGA